MKKAFFDILKKLIFYVLSSKSIGPPLPPDFGMNYLNENGDPQGDFGINFLSENGNLQGHQFV